MQANSSKVCDPSLSTDLRHSWSLCCFGNYALYYNTLHQTTLLFMSSCTLPWFTWSGQLSNDSVKESSMTHFYSSLVIMVWLTQKCLGELRPLEWMPSSVKHLQSRQQFHFDLIMLCCQIPESNPEECFAYSYKDSIQAIHQYYRLSYQTLL